MKKLEAEKKEQDEMIANLQQQLKEHRDACALHKAQLAAQAAETEKARTTLQEAAKEMELVEIEKREYLQKWQSSVTGMANRDTALQAANAALQQHKEKVRSLEVALKGYQARIRAERTTSEKLHEILAAGANDAKYIDEQIKTNNDSRYAERCLSYELSAGLSLSFVIFSPH